MRQWLLARLHRRQHWLLLPGLAGGLAVAATTAGAECSALTASASAPRGHGPGTSSGATGSGSLSGATGSGLSVPLSLIWVEPQ